MLILPTEKSIPKVNNPKFLILFGRPKAGRERYKENLIDIKTSAVYMSNYIDYNRAKSVKAEMLIPR